MKHLFEVGERIHIQSYFNDPRVVKEATRVAESGSLNGRTFEQKRLDCSNGYALQYAVLDTLKTKGVDVSEAIPKEYDLVVNLHGKTLHIDVKGIFKPDARTYSQSGWEYDHVSLLDHDVIYLCFDCRSGEAIYDGWTDQEGFRPSKFYRGGAFIYADDLNK